MVLSYTFLLPKHLNPLNSMAHNRDIIIPLDFDSSAHMKCLVYRELNRPNELLALIRETPKINQRITGSLLTRDRYELKYYQ